MQDVTVADLLLHLHTCGMLHQQIFSGTCGHMLGSCASRSSPALAHMRVAMLADLLLHLHRSHARKLRCRIFSCTCPHTEYYASRCCGALAHMQDATLAGLLFLEMPNWWLAVSFTAQSKINNPGRFSPPKKQPWTLPAMKETTMAVCCWRSQRENANDSTCKGHADLLTSDYCPLHPDVTLVWHV